MISVVLAASSGWVTISQSRHGAQVNTIKKQMAGEALDYGPMIQQTLGYLWHLPADSTSTEGLGGGITWAWDPELCANFQPQFREDFFFIEYISCKDLKAAMHRAFMSWSANHAYISFVDVTTECEKLDRQRGGEGKAWAQCPLVEIWVTGLAPPPPPPVSAESASPPPPPPSPTSPPPPARRHLEASHPRREGEDYDLECADEDCEINVDVGGAFYQETADQAAATALPMAKVAYSFRYTSGQDAGVLDAQGRANPKPTIETYGATLSFNTQLCWCALAADAARRPPARAARAPPALLADARPPHPPARQVPRLDVLRALPRPEGARRRARHDRGVRPHRHLLPLRRDRRLRGLPAPLARAEGVREGRASAQFRRDSAQFRRDSSDARLALGRCAATAGRRASSATPSSTRSPSGRSSAARCGC